MVLSLFLLYAGSRLFARIMRRNKINHRDGFWWAHGGLAGTGHPTSVNTPLVGFIHSTQILKILKALLGGSYFCNLFSDSNRAPFVKSFKERLRKTSQTLHWPKAATVNGKPNGPRYGCGFGRAILTSSAKYPSPRPTQPSGGLSCGGCGCDWRRRRGISRCRRGPDH